MKINPDYVSPCGLYCGVCAIHIAHRDNNEKFKKTLETMNLIDQAASEYRDRPQDVEEDCQSEE